MTLPENHPQFLDPDDTKGPFWNFTWWEMGTRVSLMYYWWLVSVNKLLTNNHQGHTCGDGVCDVHCQQQQQVFFKGIHLTIPFIFLAELYFSKIFFQAAGGGTLTGNECSLCDALKLSKHGRQHQLGLFFFLLFILISFTFLTL